MAQFSLVPPAAPTASAGTASAAPLTLFQRLAFWSLIPLLLFAFSRANEFLPIPYAVRGPALLCLAAGILTGGFFRAAWSPPGILLVLFTFWMGVSLPFSVWKGGSFALLTESWLISLLIFFAISGALNTFSQCRWAAYTVGAASTLIVVLSFRFGGGERLSFAWGTLGNPNDFAAFLLLGVPFCLYAFVDQKRLFPLKFAALLTAAGLVILALRSGSRAGFITLLAVAGVMFWKLSLPGKLKLSLVALIAVPLIVPFVPETTWQRLTTLGRADRETVLENPELSRATSSFWARRRLLLDALELTWRNPLLGVGPGQFQPAAAGMAASRGEHALWRETHNTYLQISSECGLPALALFLALLGYCLRSMNRLRRQAASSPALAPVANLAGAVYFAVSIYAFVALFGSYGYTMMLPAYAAFAEALSRTARPLLRPAPAAPSLRPSPSPAPRRSLVRS